MVGESQDKIPAGDKIAGLPYRWVALATVCLGAFITTMDASITNIALPVLAQVFRVDLSTVLWVSLAYILTLTGLLLTVGRLSDTLGRKRLYTLGFAIFSVGLGLNALAQGIEQLFFFRILQAVGASMVIANGVAIATMTFPQNERGRALGLLEAIVGMGLMTGPALGGLLLDAFGWRAVFYVRTPIGILGSAVAVVVLRELHPPSRQEGFDFGGAAALFLGLSLLFLGFNRGEVWGWGSLPVQGALFLGLVFLGVFFLVERHFPHPVLDLNLLRNRLFAVSNSSILFFFLGTTAINFLMPFYLIRGLGYPASQSGLLLTSIPFMWFTLSPLSGWLSEKVDRRWQASAGLAVVTLGVFLLSQLSSQATSLDVVWRLLVTGLGGALFLTPNLSSIMGSVPAPRLGTASALVATMRSIGISTGMTLAGAIFANRYAVHLASLGNPSPTGDSLANLALMAAIREALLVSVALAGMAVLICALQGSSPPSQAPAQKSHRP